MKSTRGRERLIRLLPVRSSLIPLEEFVLSCPFLSQSGRGRALIAATEVFDNIIEHNRGIRFAKVTVSLKQKAGPELTLRYFSLNFADLVLASGKDGHFRFDPAADRYRGLGLTMCRNLAKSIEYRKGLFKSAIIIIL